MQAVKAVREPKDYLDERSARAKRRWDEVWSNPISAKKNWQRIAFMEGLALIVSVGGLIYLGTLPKQIAYVIERQGNRVAYAGPLRPTNMDDATWNEVKLQQLRRWLEAWRTVTSDRTAQAADANRAFLFIGSSSPAEATLRRWYQANDPIQRLDKGEVVSVRYKSYEAEGQNTFLIWWDEAITSLNGSQAPITRSYQARVVFRLQPPTDPAVRAENPLGLLITELSFEEVQQ